MKKLLKTILKVFVCVIVAASLASAASYFMLRKSQSAIHNGIWETDLAAGSDQAGLYQRAQVALYGLWALRSSETVYFIAKTDSEGGLLNRKCVYSIEGRDPDTRWWSLAAYNNYHYIPNTENRYSFAKTNVQREADDGWKIRLANQKQEKNWLPSGESDGELWLLLRVYNPNAEFVKHLDTVSLPKVVKEGCQ